MYDYRCKGCENLVHCMHMPMMNMPMFEEEDEDLKGMYPNIYIRINPMVKYHCDMMESMYGPMYCPSKDEMDHICKEICDSYEKHHKDVDDYDDRNDNDDDDMRQRRRQGRRGITRDLIRILLIRNLLGRRRRRRRPHFGY